MKGGDYGKIHIGIRERDAICAQVVHPADILKLMGL